ncbi:hypothetical protein LINGRAHAP2_LOCUS25273 [Linum grandiflorum]
MSFTNEELHRLLKPFFTKRADSDEDNGGIDNGYVTSAVSYQEAEKNPTQRRNVIRIELRKDQDSSNLLKPVGKASTATAPPPKPAEETETKPTEGGKVIVVQKVRDLYSSNFNKAVGKARTAAVAPYSPPPKPAQETDEDLRNRRMDTRVKDLHSSNFHNHKPTTSTTVVRKAVTVTPAPKRNLEEEEYEKKLEIISKMKFREGYNQYTDSRKRSKITHYIPPKSNHDQLLN